MSRTLSTKKSCGQSFFTLWKRIKVAKRARCDKREEFFIFATDQVKNY
jgi:hypothetical protein